MLRAVFLILATIGLAVGASGYVNRPIVFINGHIQTMDPNNSVVRSLGLQSGYILAAGEEEAVLRRMRQRSLASSWHIRLFGVRVVDLQGRVVVPGFVDAHGHFPANGLAGIGIDLSSPPFGQVLDIPMLLQEVRNKALRQSEERWIIGLDYDESALQEQRHPSRFELDLAAPRHAVYLRHRSGHMGVANSAALQDLGYAVTSGSDGKPLLRRDGLLQEKAAPGMQRLLEEVPWWSLPSIFFQAREDYLLAGVTTLQNGFADKATFQLLRFSARVGLLPQRVLVWPADEKLRDRPDFSSRQAHQNAVSTDNTRSLANAIDWPSDDRRHVAIGAIKIIVDGSPQGRTAWLSRPYLDDDFLTPGYRGSSNLPQEKLDELVSDYHKAGFQLALHGNGDQAIQSIIEALQHAHEQFPRPDARHVVVHAQTITPAQLTSLEQIDVSVSFFPTHVFYWGDWYRKRVLGESRAAMISPLASADDIGVRYTIHADAPVTPFNPMQMLWSATQRETASGYVLGADQRVSRQRALRALTIDAAWQNHLDGDRGSLEVGKLADLVVLSGNPLTSADVRDITVKQVWIGGRQHL